MRSKTFYTKTIVDGTRFKKCQCGQYNSWSCRVCRYCRKRMERRPSAAKPRRGTPEWLTAELVHASKMSDAWTSKVKRAITAMHYWAKRERALAARIAAGPQPPRPKKKAPKTRALDLE